LLKLCNVVLMAVVHLDKAPCMPSMPARSLRPSVCIGGHGSSYSMSGWACSFTFCLRPC